MEYVTPSDEARIVTAHRDIAASTDTLFELIADPSRQPEWDGNDNLASSAPGQRVHAVGDTFTTELTNGAIRENRIVEFVEGSVIAWQPSPVGEAPPGHVWRYELEPLPDGATRVSHTYDWTQLHDENRIPKARATTSDRLAASLERLAVVAEDRPTAT